MVTRDLPDLLDLPDLPDLPEAQENYTTLLEMTSMTSDFSKKKNPLLAAIRTTITMKRNHGSDVSEFHVTSKKVMFSNSNKLSS